MGQESPSGTDYWRALLRAYSADAPEDVRDRVRRWQLDEEGPGPSVVDLLQDSLNTLHKLIRIAYEERETWLVDVLEQERQSVAAQAAFALAADQEEKNASNPTR